MLRCLQAIQKSNMWNETLFLEMCIFGGKHPLATWQRAMLMRLLFRYISERCFGTQQTITDGTSKKQTMKFATALEERHGVEMGTAYLSNRGGTIQ